MRTLYLFSSTLECDAAFPDGIPSDVAVRITGVGIVDAAIGASHAIASVNPDEIVFLGTCGAHRESGLNIGDIVYASTVRIGSGDVARRDMRIPKLMRIELACDASIAQRVIDRSNGAIEVRPASVSCTVGITESDDLATLLFEHDGSDVETLEAYGVLRTAPDIPVAIMLAVTNIVGAGGGKDWHANYSAAMSGLARAFVRSEVHANDR